MMKRTSGIIILLTLVVSLAGLAGGQVVKPGKPASPPKPAPKPTPVLPGTPMIWQGWENDGVTTERSIAVDPNVNLTMCVVEGRVRIEGWNRSELRILVREGNSFAFKIKEKGKGDQPVWVNVLGASGKGSPKAFPDCIWGEEIEIDVPVSATLDLRGQETRTTIDTVRRANIKVIGGNISARNVSEGVTASTYEGDITVEESKGRIELDTTSGNIIVFQAGPSQIGDIFKVKTNSGVISLQRIEHRQVDVGSISGSVFYSGAILPGGAYSFGTSNGTVRLSVPEKTNCQVSATFGGTFMSELPFKRSTEDIKYGPVKTVNGTLGTGGDAIVKLTNNSGVIAIRKLPQ